MEVFFGLVLIFFVIAISIKAASGEKRVEKERLARIAWRYEDVNVRQKIQEKKIWQGMTRDELVDSWGEPSGVTEQVLKTKIKNTYRYGSNRHGSSVYLDNGRVTGWRQ